MESHQPSFKERLVPSLNSSQAENCNNTACLAHKQSLLQEIQNLKHKLTSLESEKQINTTSNFKLKLTLEKERDNFERERESWNSFKRDYASLVVEKLNDLTNKFIDQPKDQLPSSSLHPLITLALEAHDQQKQKVTKFFRTQSHLSHSQDPAQSTSKLNVDNLTSDPLLKNCKSAVDASFIESGSTSPSPNHTLLPTVDSLNSQILHSPRPNARDASDLAQESTRKSSHLNRTLSSSPPKSCLQVPNEMLFKNDKTENRTSSETPKKISPLSHKSPSNKGSPNRNKNSIRRNLISPNKFGRSPVRRNRISSPGWDRTSPGRNLISPRRNGITPGKTSLLHGGHRDISATRNRQLNSTKSKPPNNSSNSTPQLLRKKNTSSASAVISRPKFTPKWIKYSDRKARVGKVIWNDDHNDEDNNVNKTKVKKNKKTHSIQTLDDVFQVQKINTIDNNSLQKNHLDVMQNSKNNLDVLLVQEPSSENLPTTEESDTESVSASIQKKKRENQTLSRIQQPNSNLKNKQIIKENIQVQEFNSLNKTHQNHSSFSSSSSSGLKEKKLNLDNIHNKKTKKENKNLKEENNQNKKLISNFNINHQFEIDPKNNYGVNHVFNEVGRGKQVRKNMRARDCECCSGYYEQVEKDFNKSKNLDNRDNDNDEGQDRSCSNNNIHLHQHLISRHRHFNPPPLTPPNYWQMGFPDTQEVEKINQKAENNKKIKLENIHLQTRDGNGPYKFKENPT